MSADPADRSRRGVADIVLDHVVPCPYCGVPCTGTFQLWYMDGEERWTFEVDRPTLDQILEAAVRAAPDEDAYRRLPAFLRDWNEGVGWAGLDDFTQVDVADVLAAVETLQLLAGVDDRLSNVLSSLHQFVARGQLEHRQLWAGET